MWECFTRIMLVIAFYVSISISWTCTNYPKVACYEAFINARSLGYGESITSISIAANEGGRSIVS